MHNPRLRHILQPAQLDELSESSQADGMPSAAEICRLAEKDPLNAARECKKAFGNMERRYQRNLREYLCATYYCAYHLKNDDAALAAFDDELVNERVKPKNDAEKLKERLMFYMCEYTCALTGRATPNSAYRYAYGLDPYLSRGDSPDYVEKLILAKGPEKIFKEAKISNRIDENIAEDFHQRHIVVAKRNGDYAAELIARGEIVLEQLEERLESISTKELEDEHFNREDDPDLVKMIELPINATSSYAHLQWRYAEVEKNFSKMQQLMTTLGAEVADSKSILENDGTFGFILEGREVKNPMSWKDSEVDTRYERVLRLTCTLNKEINDLKLLLERLLTPPIESESEAETEDALSECRTPSGRRPRRPRLRERTE